MDEMVLPLEEKGGLRRLSVEQAEWEALCAEMLPRIFHFFCYRVGDSQSAEDLTSETFERAWRRRQRFRNDLGAFSSWLFGIARKVAAEDSRRKRPEVTLIDGSLSGHHASAEVVAERNTEFARLAALLAELPERERELVALKYGAGLTNRAVAEMAGLSESNVGTILHRVVRRLRARWEVDDG